jgi:signal-transduction protein with cAMP-binding, CBS, and nucleotidyltransferase domain
MEIDQGEGNVESMQTEIGSDEPISYYTQSALLIDEGSTVRQAAKLMKLNKAGSIIVERKGSPLGIITEWDVLTRLVARGKSASRTKVTEIMSRPLIKIDYETPVGDALRLMIDKGVRRLVVVRSGKFLGVITQSQIIGDKRSKSLPLHVLESDKATRCPYCNIRFDNAESIRGHIEKIHISLEGVESR